MVGKTTSYTLLCPSPASTCDWPESASTTAMQNWEAEPLFGQGRCGPWPGPHTVDLTLWFSSRAKESSQK